MKQRKNEESESKERPSSLKEKKKKDMVFE